MSSLDSLNASERELLLLLGAGHTAKTIATLKGLSELAVNERFRSARRKTGIGSSREIARLLVARENRDDFIGLAEPSVQPPASSRSARPKSGRVSSRWRIAMFVAGLAALTLIVPVGLDALKPQDAPPANPPAAMANAPENPFVTAAQQQPDIAALSAEARSGRSDPEWSDEAKTRLATAYRSEPGMSSLQTLSVICSDVLCEVLGETADDTTTEAVTSLIGHAQSPAILDAAKGLGLEREVSSVRTSNGRPFKGMIVSYWRRRAS